MFVDRHGVNVAGADIFNCISGHIESKQCIQLVVYFSGHGISRGPSQEFWLLSNAGINPNEFINFTSSFDNACYSSIPYVLFISDACRSLPGSFNQTTGGQIIFPSINSDDLTTADVFFATRPGAAALEVSSTNLTESYGIFTECLIDYLEGNFTDTVVNNAHNSKNYLADFYDRAQLLTNSDYKSLPDPNDKWIISAVEVDLKLRGIVEEKAFQFNKMQSPEIRVRNHKTEFPLAAFTDSEGKELVIGPDVDACEEFVSPEYVARAEVMNFSAIKDLSSEMYGNRFLKGENLKIVEREKNNGLMIPAHLFWEFGADIKQGFTLLGAKVYEVIVPGRKLDFFQIDQQRASIEIPDQFAELPVLLILQDGSSIPLPVIRGFIGNLIFKKGQLFTINFTPSKQNRFTYDQYINDEAMLLQKRNYIAIAANNGFSYQSAFESLAGNADSVFYRDPGSYLRIGKSLDPSLGLYAAYAFREAGEVDMIKSVYSYMRDDNPKVIFDVAMLSGNLLEQSKVTPFCPVMATGWAYDHLYKGKIGDNIMAAAKYLRPGLWTTFDATGTEIITRSII